jgi:hypothetical protein
MKNILSTVRGWVVVGVVLGSGVAWAFYPEVCTIPGTDGNCKVNAFINGENSVDKDAKTCNKLLKSEYQGTCVNGSMQGIALIKRAHQGGVTHYLGKFEQGVSAELIIDYDNSLIGVRDNRASSGCVYFGGRFANVEPWDARATSEKCIAAKNLLGNEFMTDETFKAIQNGTYRLLNQVSKPSNTSSQRDDPKVFGRSARGG